MAEQCIAIDAMGGEGGPSVTVHAALDALEANPSLSVILVGNADQIDSELSSAGNQIEGLAQRFTVEASESVFLDTQKPAAILRSGKSSSLFRALELHQQGRVSAVVSAGNTGALLLASRHLLKSIPGIELPAIVASLPVGGRSTLLLDVGANLQCTPQQLEQFAIMGNELARSNCAQPPRVALLNVGAEEHKGTDKIQLAAALLESNPHIAFAGFVEANQAFMGLADVIVCDGFAGNVMIKASAGAANAVIHELEAVAANGNPSTQNQFARVAQAMSPQQFNGASILGLCGNVIKSHGNASRLGFAEAVAKAYAEQLDGIPDRIFKALAASR